MWIMTNMEPKAGLALYDQRMKIEMALRYQKCELAFESPHVQTWNTRDKLLGLATLPYAFLLSLLAPDYQPLTRWLLDTWCPRNEKRSQSCLAPPYRLRLALARLWLTYPLPFLLILGSG